MYKVVEQPLLLYCIDSWLVTGETLNILEGFHHWAARHITGMKTTYGAAGEWYYSLMVVAI